MATMTAETGNDELRFPIGDFTRPVVVTSGDLERWIDDIRQLPVRIRAAVDGLNEEQLASPYRPGGWTVKQTVHHLADSHINSICRFKLAMTEENPTIRPYFEDRWAELADSRLPVETSLALIDNLHARFTALLESFTADDFARTLVHPDNGQFTVGEFLALYAWHGRHHTAHLTALRKRKNW